MQLGELLTLLDDPGRELELLEELGGGRVALGVDPGPVEGVLPFADLEESGGLRVGRRANPFDLHQLRPAGVRPLLGPTLDNPPRRELVQARDVPQERDAGGVEVDADEVHATGDHPFERLLELLGIHVMLIEPDPDVLRLDLDEFGQRVLESSADRDRASDLVVEVGELLAADGADRIDAGAGLVDDHVGELRELLVGRVRPGRGRRTLRLGGSRGIVLPIPGLGLAMRSARGFRRGRRRSFRSSFNRRRRGLGRRADGGDPRARASEATASGWDSALVGSSTAGGTAG